MSRDEVGFAASGGTSDLDSVASLILLTRAFAHARGWQAAHTAHGLVLSLVSELGELAAEVRWLHPADVADAAELSPELRAAVEAELGDVFFALLRLADVLEVDLPRAMATKLQATARKYPTDAGRAEPAG